MSIRPRFIERHAKENIHPIIHVLSSWHTCQCSTTIEEHRQIVFRTTIHVFVQADTFACSPSSTERWKGLAFALQRRIAEDYPTDEAHQSTRAWENSYGVLNDSIYLFSINIRTPMKEKDYSTEQNENAGIFRNLQNRKREASLIHSYTTSRLLEFAFVGNTFPHVDRR